MQNLSSQMTLFLKFVLPIFWITFFGTVAAYATFEAEGSYITKVVFITLLLLGIPLMYWRWSHLKRVEADEEFLYVTNYLKVYRYPFENIEKVEEKRGFIHRRVNIFFKEPGSFGKKIQFLEGSYYREYLKQHPEIAKHFEAS